MRSSANAQEHRFETIMVVGQPMIFTKAHRNRATISTDSHMYTVRRHSGNREKPIQVCVWTLANRYGLQLTTTPILLPEYDNSLKSIYNYRYCPQ